MGWVVVTAPGGNMDEQELDRGKGPSAHIPDGGGRLPVAPGVGTGSPGRTGAPVDGLGSHGH